MERRISPLGVSVKWFVFLRGVRAAGISGVGCYSADPGLTTIKCRERAWREGLVSTVEQWRPIPGFESYAVSDLGRVKRLARSRILFHGALAHWDEKILSPGTVRGNYQAVKLSIDGSKCMRIVGPLVLRAFVGPPPEGFQAAHENGDPKDNRLVNLKWKSRSENEADKLKHGTALTSAKRSEFGFRGAVARWSNVK